MRVGGKGVCHLFRACGAKLDRGRFKRGPFGVRSWDGREEFIFFDFFRPSLAIFRRVWYTTKKLTGKILQRPGDADFMKKERRRYE